MRSWGIAAALLLGLPLSAQAQSVEQVFQNFGLNGVWANVCNQPANLESGNSRAIYALSSSDGIMLTYDYGTKYRPRGLHHRQRATGGARPRLLGRGARAQQGAGQRHLHKAKDRITVVSSVAQDGKVYVENGKIVSNGQPAPTQTRCP